MPKLIQMVLERSFERGLSDPRLSMRMLVRRYIAHRRKMGYRVNDAAKRLPDFGRFADRVAPGKPLTTAIALQWATLRPTQRRATHAGLLGIVRCFARYCALLDPRTEVPDTYLLGPTYRRIRPHIYTKRQVRLILRRARALKTKFSLLHPMTYETLIGLLACTGMRPGEALRLRLNDLDAESGLLRIAPNKFSPERAIPLHNTVIRALQRYRMARRRLFPFGEHLFVSTIGSPLQARTTEKIFIRLARGIPSNGQRPSLRLLDYRHTFASDWISQWSRQSKPVSHHLLLLARYLGHQEFSSTWWYVSSDPKALQAAAQSFLRFHKKGGP
jgi:integrase